MNAVYHIAVNTLKESIRNKVLYNILFLAIGIILFSISLGDWSVFARAQVMQDFGLAAMSVTGLLMSVFIGAGMLGREIADRTVYGIVTKPVARWAFVIGKYAGLLAVLLLNFLVISACLVTAVLALGGAPHTPLAYAIGLIWIEMALIVAVSFMCSCFTTPVLSAIFTTAFYVAGHLNDLLSVETYAKPNMALLRVIYYLLPNLEHFNVRAAAIYGTGLPGGYMAWACVYGVCYIALALVFSCILFGRKDL